MLNRSLYAALRAAAGEVLVDNEGQAAELELVGGRWRIQPGGAHGEQYRINCPCCDDHGHHLYISYLSLSVPVRNGQAGAQIGLLAHCFRRDCMASRQGRARLMQLIGVGMATADVTSQGLDVSDGDETSEMVSRLSDEPTTDGIRTWSPLYSPVMDGGVPQDCFGYILRRGLLADDLREMKVGWGQVISPRSGKPIGGGANWLQFPVMHGGRLVGLQARFVGEPPKGLGKYWFHPGTLKRSVVYGLDRARDMGCVVLCEGVFDALHVGRPGVCCFGHTPSVVQRRLIEGTGKCAILLPDTDTHADLDTIARARQLALDWSSADLFAHGAHVVVLPAKDAGEMDRQSIWTAILSQVDDPTREYLLSEVLPRM